MIKKMLLSLSLLCALVSAQAHAFLEDDQVYFIDGFDRDEILIESDTDLVNSSLLPDLSGPEGHKYVIPLYVKNAQVLSGMVARMQAYIAQGSKDASRDWVKQNWLAFWKSLNCPDTSQVVGNPCTNIIQKTLNQYDEAAYVTQPDLQAMVRILQDNYNNAIKYNNSSVFFRKMLVIAHGHGNFYANQLWNYLKLNNPDIAKCVGIVGIGTPATYVANGQYTTNDIDKVVNLTRTMAPWGTQTLLANYNLSSSWLSRDITAHHIFETYGRNSGLNAKIRSQLQNVASQLDSACPPPPPPPLPPLKCVSKDDWGYSLLTKRIETTVGPGRQYISVWVNDEGVPLGQETSIITELSVSTSAGKALLHPFAYAKERTPEYFTIDGGRDGGSIALDLASRNPFGMYFQGGPWSASITCN